MADRIAKTRIGKITIKDGAARSMMAMDGMMNVLTGLGGSLDPQSNAFYYVRPLDQQSIESSYRTSWLSKKVHTVPAKDATRAWRQFKADDVDITKIEREERRLGLRNKVRRAEVLSRLYGGSCLMLGTGGDMAQPLNPSTIKQGGLKYIHAVGRYEITIPNLILDPGSEFYLQPDMYMVNAGNGTQVRVHPSRMIRFTPSDTPDNVSLYEQGWGDPLLQSLQGCLINADTMQGTFAALVAKAKVDTLGIPNLTQIASTSDGEQQLQRRVLVAQAFESMFHTKLIDTAKNNGDAAETWEQFQVNWSGMPEMAMMFLQMVSGASDIPMTRLVGKSPDGMNATGDGDLENYFQMISASQELDLRPRLEMLDEVLLRSALGERPEDIWFSFLPLRTDSEETKAKNAKARAEASAIYVDKQLVPDEVMQEAVKGQLIESGEYPGIERAYIDYAEGNLLPIIEQEDEPPVDSLIPVDPTTGLPTQNRESRLFAANDMAGKMVTAGMSVTDAYKEVLRLTDAEPRPLYVARYLTNGEEVKAHFEAQGLKVTVAPDRMHTTLIYSRTPLDWFKIAPMDWGDEAKLIVPAGGPRMMAKFGPNENAIVLMFASSRMSWRHEEFIREGASYDFEYQPHLTLNYEGQDIDLTTIKPYQGELRFGYERFEEIREDWAK